MFRTTVTALVTLTALAALDYFCFNGWYTHAAEAVVLNICHFVIDNRSALWPP
jgi:hypothetical protein